MKKICLLLIVTVILLVFLASSALAFETDKTLTLAADGIKSLRIDCGAGRLEVTGSAGADKIEVQARIHATGHGDDEARFIADHVTLKIEKNGDLAVLTSHIDSHRSFFSFGDTGIDVSVILPKTLALEIDDGSGEIVVEDIGADVSIEDGSGEIRVSRIIGNLEIDDDSGEVEIREVSGDVSVDDGSGSIDIVQVGGRVRVDDGSGSIDIDGVGLDVEIVESGSGGVHISNVKGRVIRRDEDD